MAEAKNEEGEPTETDEVTRKEHDVRIVLSFRDDEHEKAAIEVRGVRLWKHREIP